ncbi:hypothetical protein MOMUL_28180 [Moorella mulderi DSM 14980]|uniref:Uncharacterized protein n=1 Tax=Moorella mulderi DSM 14980 TaxID=1122241 RepID=A0A151ATW4_9FIRM|nr:hypothetical protein MOMUL_28180 [Moorella mulderi DSM 14980]
MEGKNGFASGEAKEKKEKDKEEVGGIVFTKWQLS